MHGFNGRCTDKTSGDDRDDPCNVGQWMEAAVPEMECFRQRALKLVGCYQAGEQFLSAALILFGKSQEPGSAVAAVTGCAAATQDEDVVGIQIANHGAIDERGQAPAGTFCSVPRIVASARPPFSIAYLRTAWAASVL